MPLTDFLAKIIEYPFRGFGKLLWGFAPQRATAVIPALNEAKTIRKVAKTALDSYFVSEVIIVDDGSTDETVKSLKGLPVRIVSHGKNLGKGRAIKTGIENASNETILFLDADLENIDSEKIRKIVTPILEGKADFVKGAFSLARGRVTEIAVKPMMKILFPEMNFMQPISGQFATKKSFLEKIQIEDRWGIDIAILLDAMQQGQRVIEVDIGKIVHKARTTEEKAEMSKQVLETMLKKSGLIFSRFKAILLSESAAFENTAPRKNVLEVVAQLRKRKAKVFLLGYTKKTLEKAKELGCDGAMLGKGTEFRLLSSIKKALKKQGIKISETIIVASEKKESILLKASGMGIYLGKNRALQKNSDKQIEGLSEILLAE